ncbi:MAG: thioredoxin family protein [Candidatus Izimaplasma sp.]|nr:thioredoxin family protein [Candidatus Izimaplasma bacterium]
MQVIKNYNDIEKIVNKNLVMIIAKTHSCSACQTVARTLETNLQYYHEVDKYEVYVDDIDKFRGEYLIFSVPTVLIFSEGKELLRESRYMSYSKMDRLIEMFNE